MKKVLFVYLLAWASAINAQNALNFDGSNDFVQTTYPGILGANNRTFEAWINVNVGAPASNLCIVDFGLNAVGSRNTFAVTGTRGLNFISGGTNANIGSTAGVITEGVWTHVAFVLNSGVGYLYVNGAQVGTGSLTSVNTPSGQNLKIGQRVTGGSIPFEGSIDEVRIWDYARTGTQLTNNLNAEFCSLPAGLVAYYQFNQGNAGMGNSGKNKLLDAVDGNEGTLTNFSLSGTTSNWVAGTTITPGLSISAGSQSVCDSLISPSGNAYWTTTGLQTDTIPNSNSCDSIISIDLTVNKTRFTNVIDSVCEAYVSPSGNYTYSTSGIYYDTTLTGKGCANYHTLDLQININDTTVSVNGNELTANEPNAQHYIWLDCADDFSQISGSNNRVFTPAQDGEYAVRITNGKCIDTSECITVVGVGLNEVNFLRQTRVYPNPASGVLNVQFAKNYDILSLNVLNVSGQEVMAQSYTNIEHIRLDINEIPKGLYLIQIETQGERWQHRLIKE